MTMNKHYRDALIRINATLDMLDKLCPVTDTQDEDRAADRAYEAWLERRGMEWIEHVDTNNEGEE